MLCCQVRSDQVNSFSLLPNKLTGDKFKCKEKEKVLTLAYETSFFVASVAGALANGDKPFSLGTAVHPGRILLLGIIDTRAPNLHQGLGVHRHCVWKHSQILHCKRALFEVHSHRHQGNASTNVLKSQIKPLFVDRSHFSYLSVEFQNAVPKVHLSKTFISGNGVNLCKLMLSEFHAVVIIRFHVVQVKGLLASPQNQWNAVAVPQCELELHVDFLSRVSGDPVGPQPIILAVIHDIAHLVSPDGCVMFINTADLFPLKPSKQRERDRISEVRVMMAHTGQKCQGTLTHKKQIHHK